MKKNLETLCGLLSGTALFAIMALTFFDVAGRKLLSNSIPGSLELTELLMVVVIFGALPPAVLNYVFAERYRQEPGKVASMVMLGNLGALLFIPIALALTLK